MSKTQQVTFDLVSVNGKVDRAASLAAAETALDEMLSTQSEQHAAISSAVAAAFDQYPNQSLTMPVLTRLVLNALGTTPEQQKATEKAVVEYVRSNAEESRKGVVPSGTTLFLTKKGLGGGVIRL